MRPAQVRLPDGRVIELSYEQYLNSIFWKLKREEVRQARGGRLTCFCCERRQGIQLHHRTYRRLGHERLTDLVPLCDRHHWLPEQMVKVGMASRDDAHERIGGPVAVRHVPGFSTITDAIRDFTVSAMIAAHQRPDDLLAEDTADRGQARVA